MAGRDCTCCATSASSTQGATAACMMDRLLSYQRIVIGRLDGLVKSLCEQVVSGFVLLLHLVSHGFARWTSPSFLRQRLDHGPMPSCAKPQLRPLIAIAALQSLPPSSTPTSQVACRGRLLGQPCNAAAASGFHWRIMG